MENHGLLFAAVNDSATSAFDEIQSDLQLQITAALDKISLMVFTSLVSKSAIPTTP
jgi:hypothetical protein